MTPIKPTAFEIDYHDPALLFAKLAIKPGLLFLDSSDHHLNPTPHNRYSYLAFEPLSWISLSQTEQPGSPLFGAIDTFLSSIRRDTLPNLPPFQGGLAGFLSYDLAHLLTATKRPLNTLHTFPYYTLACYDWVLSYDHQQQRAWFVHQPQLITGLKRPSSKMLFKQVQGHIKKRLTLQEQMRLQESAKPVELTSRCEHATYLQQVQQIIAAINQGTVFQTNLTQRWQTKLIQPPHMTYQKLRQLNPAPYSGYFQLTQDSVIASSSPECFLKKRKHHIASYPIKGTINRSQCNKQDIVNQTTLKNNPKDLAEHIMIVDLIRNDLAKIAEANSVHVEELAACYPFANLHHLIAKISATLKPNLTYQELLEATFPCGSITGAPKLSAMNLIRQLEQENRGPYCGALGYFSVDGSMDLSVLIRTLLFHENHCTFSAGGAIVRDSDPLQEANESLLKINRIKQALRFHS